MIGGRAVWSNLIFFISALGWNENFISAARWNENSMSAKSWNGIYSLKWTCAPPKDEFMVARAGQFTIQIPYKYRLVEPAEPVGLAHARIAARAIQLKWKSPAEMEFSFQPSSWNGIFISAQSWNENSIKILVAQRDHFPFHLRASVELPVLTNFCWSQIFLSKTSLPPRQYCRISKMSSDFKRKRMK